MPDLIASRACEARGTEYGAQPEYLVRKRGVIGHAKDIGQEPVTYVGNIYKYYIAYKLAVEQAQLREKSEAAPVR